MKVKGIFLFLIILLSIPTFYRMLNYGIFSTQDFHFFRLFEFDKCIQRLEIPCRWAADAGLGFGEPLFNFYPQLSYALGEIFHLIGFSIIDSLKIIFALSLVLSGVSMFYLSKYLWKNELAGLVSAIVYIYAPYRAVDVWVRGALPEALSFVFFPLIILFFEKRKYLLLSLSLAGLVLTHNLSFILFAPFLLVWIVFRLVSEKKVSDIKKLLISGISAFGLSSFYVLPVIFESKFIEIEKYTTTGYFDFRAHFITIYQIFISRFWGYGGSTWGSEDGVSLAIGILQWVIPLIIGFAILFMFLRKKKINFDLKIFVLLLFTGLFYLFMTHNKSTFIWESIYFMKYIQFPWRFLGQALFAFSLLSGSLITFFSGKRIVVISFIIVALAMILNFSYFREDIWYKFSDNDLTTGNEWVRQRTASIGDFWPKFGHMIPSSPSDGKYINYFPGWVGATVDDNGLIPSEGVKFTNTPIRNVGNVISLVSIVGLIAYTFKFKGKAI